MKKILLDNKENIFLSKELITLYPCDLDLTWKDLKIKEADYSEIHKLFHELEFKKLLKELPALSSDLKLNIKKGITQDILDQIRKSKELIFFFNEDKAYILDDKKDCTYEAKMSEIKDVLGDEEIKKISFGLKEQIIHLKDKDIEIKGIWFDVEIAAYLIESSFVDYSLSELVSHYLGHLISDISPDAFPYFIGQLYKVLSPKLKKDDLEELFFKVEMPLIWVLADMQEWGVKIDTTIMKNLLKEVGKELKEVEKKIFEIAGKKFNLNSPKQLRVILFEDLKISPLKKTKTGYSTGEDVLEKLAQDYPIAKLLLEYRQSNKLKTTYILPLIEDVERKGGKLHAQFNQTSTQTGRLSSSSPNLQSIPTKGKFSSYLRKAFIPSFKEGFLLSADYSQIELRILAHFSEDEHLLEAFKKDLDIHTYTASLLFGIKEKDVVSAQRNLAKKVNFGIVYGMSSYGLSKELNIDVNEAQSFIDDYFLRYAKVKNFINKVHREAERTGAVKTIMGRRRNLADFNSSNPHLREFARRQAINAPIQGSCADLIKMAMVNLYGEFKKRNLGTKIIIQIHDELLFDVPKNELKEVAEIARNYMQESIKLNVPIKVNIKTGKNWAEMKEVK